LVSAFKGEHGNVAATFGKQLTIGGDPVVCGHIVISIDYGDPKFWRVKACRSAEAGEDHKKKACAGCGQEVP
jgi:hypothetical protein